MDQIRVSNLRCIADSGMVEIKPITLLVGANSSGKSSFLRVFPLLKQSVETQTISGLLLNEGDVDFGFFNEAIHGGASELKLEFSFIIKNGLYQGGELNPFLAAPLPITCELTYAKRAIDQHYPFLRSVVLTMRSQDAFDEIKVVADEEGKISKFKVNEFEANDELLNWRLRVGRGVVPGLIQELVDDVNSTGLQPDEDSENELFDANLIEATKNLFHIESSKEMRLGTLRNIRIGVRQDMLTAMKDIHGANYWNQQVSNWTLETPMFRKVRELLLGRTARKLLSSARIHVSQLARSVHYFQPVRASVMRDYSSRDVEVGSVDPSGLNVAMVLASLRTDAQQQFRDWMSTHFGFEVFPKKVGDGARIALRMKESGTGMEFNLADMGFGFSQMLPFLLEIWTLVEYKPRRRRFRGSPVTNLAIPTSWIIAIEQPELHLHPALQARVADLFVAMAVLSRERDVPVRFFLETHSPTIIERIGQHVEGGRLKSEDVQVLLFERGLENQQASTASVQSVTFDSKGVLQDWPFGFLSAPFDPLPELPPAPASMQSASE